MSEQTYTLEEIREMQCEQCSNEDCDCRSCKGELDKCGYGTDVDNCEWNHSETPICDGFTSKNCVW